jgi:signal transduction histidine kinase
MLPRTWGIKQKLWLLAGGLFSVLVLAGCLSLILMLRINQSIEATFKNNGDSVAYMHDLTDAVKDLDQALRGPMDPRHPWRRQALDPFRRTIERCINGEFQCISEAGEQEAAQALQERWLHLKQDLQAPKALKGPQWKAFYQRTLAPDLASLQSIAWSISGMNLRNTRFVDHGHSLLASGVRGLVLLLVLGAGLGVVLVLALGRSLVEPVLELTRGVRSVEQGRLDLNVPVRQEDEMGQLALAFNAMAERLRQHDRGFRARLLRAQRITQMAINSFSDPVAVLNPAGLVEICNRSAEALFGLKAGQSLAGGPLAGLQSLVPPVLAGSPHEPEGYDEAMRVTVGGKEKYVLPRLLPVQDDRGRVLGVTLVLADVTTLRKMDNMKSGLLATISHELKNPLTSLRMGAGLLLEDSLGPRTPRQEAILTSLRDNSERLHGILDELLELGRLQSGDLLHLESRPAGQLLKESIQRAQGDAATRGISVEVEIAKKLPAVAVDPRRISHVFSNLFENAVKFSPPGSTIWTGAERDGRSVRFWMQDSGPGVSEEFRSRIFERFFRAPGQPASHGQGLGLAIAREVAELHGGSLKLEDSAVGARFVLTLPADDTV